MKYTKKTGKDEFVTLDTNQDEALDILLYSTLEQKKKTKKKQKKKSHSLFWIIMVILFFPIFIIIALLRAGVEVTDKEENKAKIRDRK